MLKDVIQPSPWYSILPLLLLGAIVVGVLFLILLAVLVARGSRVSRTGAGAVTLALASAMLLTGIWCLALSPMDRRYESVLNAQPSIQPSGYWAYSASFAREDVISSNIYFQYTRPLYESTSPLKEIVVRPEGNYTPQAFTFLLRDTDGQVVWRDEDVTYSSFSVKAEKTGAYAFRVENKGTAVMVVSISISKTMPYRPLEPFGQWLALISLPFLGLGVWAALPRQMKEREPSV